MRAFLAGGFWAVLVGGGALAVLSLAMDPPQAPDQIDPPEAAAAAPQTAVPETAVPETTVPETAVETETAVEAAPVTPPQASAPVAEVPSPPEPQPEIQPEPETQSQIMPSAALPQSTADVRVNRPRAAPDTATAELMPDEMIIAPLQRFAADFDYAADLPMIALVLLDDPLMRDAPAVLRQLPFVPSVVLNATTPGVTARMQAYRAAGIELLLQADLPPGAQPSDLAVIYSGAFALVPEAIALFSDGTGPEVTERALADHALRLIGDAGRGFVTLPRGLGGAMRNVATDGVPVAQIARRLDAGGETRDAITRSLQQAALRARQSGHVVLLGQMTPETLAAIRDWAARSDPAQISLAPVSAILLGQLAQ
jgi:hypothetical protein